ncbi:GtrA family protein [Flaviflagellibacter deserti]|uniref:GtrA family protein n=1 Tax=Flaviflagellibacter deserti TaxID=2267266 RepID=A0ABV9YWL4_9HYPH
MKSRITALMANQVFRFLLLGGFAAAVNWIVRFPLSLVMPFPAAVLVAYMIGMGVGFTLYRTYVFPGSSRTLLEQSLTFLGVNLVGAVVVLVLTDLFLGLQSGSTWPEFMREGLAHGFAIGVGAVVNFFGHKLLTFRGARRAAAV